HLVAGTDAGGPQRQLDRVAAVADANRVRRADVGGELRLEALQRVAKDEVAPLADLADGAIDLGGERVVLRMEVHEGDHFLLRAGAPPPARTVSHRFKPRPR